MTRCRAATQIAMMIFLGISVSACARRAEPVPAPEPAVAVQASVPDPASYPDTLVCVVERGATAGLGTVNAKRDPATGELLVSDDAQWRPFADRYPATGAEGYANEQTWFVTNDPIRLQDNRYVKVGVRRVIAPEQIAQVDAYNGVPVFADARETPPYSAVYLPSEPGCVFQAYAREAEMRRVRG